MGKLHQFFHNSLSFTLNSFFLLLSWYRACMHLLLFHYWSILTLKLPSVTQLSLSWSISSFLLFMVLQLLLLVQLLLLPFILLMLLHAHVHIPIHIFDHLQCGLLAWPQPTDPLISSVIVSVCMILPPLQMSPSQARSESHTSSPLKPLHCPFIQRLPNIH